MVSPGSFVDGTRVRWQLLAGTIFGGALLAFWEGITRVILRIADAFTGLIGGLANFQTQLVLLIYSAPAAIIRGSWDEALGFVVEAGPLAFIVAIAITLAVLWVVSWGWSRLG